MPPKSIQVASAPSGRPAPTSAELMSMSDADLAAEVECARALRDAEYWRFSRGSRVRPGGPGTDRYGRAMRERTRRIQARRLVGSLPLASVLRRVQLARELARVEGAARALRSVAAEGFAARLEAHALGVLAAVSS